MPFKKYISTHFMSIKRIYLLLVVIASAYEKFTASMLKIKVKKLCYFGVFPSDFLIRFIYSLQKSFETLVLIIGPKEIPAQCTYIILFVFASSLGGKYITL